MLSRKLIAALLIMTANLAYAAEEPPSASARLAAPGPEHLWLAPLVGNWSVEMLVYPGPESPPTEIPGLIAERSWILDGRYLREELRSNDVIMREATFGFNRLDQRFELVTVDVFEPGQMVYTGRGNDRPSSLALFGTSVEAGMGEEPTGRHRQLRFTVDIVDDDTNIQRIFVTYPGEAEYLFVEQTFSRSQE